MNLNWTGAARADLRSIRATIARNSPRYADRMLERIADNAARLVDLPYLGAVVSDYDNELREVFEHPYRIFYRLPGPR